MPFSPAEHDRADIRALLALGIATVCTIAVDLASTFTRTDTGTRLGPPWVAAVRYLFRPLVGEGISTGAARAISLAAVFAQAFIVVYLIAEGTAWMHRRARVHRSRV